MKKQNVIIGFALVAAYLLLAPACQKQQIAVTPATPTVSGTRIQVKLKSDEQEMLADLFRKEGVKDSVDFINKINYVKSQCNSKRPLSTAKITATDDDNYSNAEEEVALADFYTTGLTEVFMGDWDYGLIYNSAGYQFPDAVIRVFKGVGIESHTFAIRGNQVMLTIPYNVGVLVRINGGEIVSVGPTADMPPTIQPLGPFWGTYNPSQTNYFQSYSNNSAIVHAQGSEIRTQVFSVEGKIKISTEANVQVFKAGVEMEAGFTIQSAVNIYNQYTLDGSCTIQLISGGANGEMPMFNFASALRMKQFGVLRNY